MRTKDKWYVLWLNLSVGGGWRFNRAAPSPAQGEVSHTQRTFPLFFLSYFQVMRILKFKGFTLHKELREFSLVLFCDLLILLIDERFCWRMFSSVGHRALHMMSALSHCVLEILEHCWNLENVNKSTRLRAGCTTSGSH